GPSPEKHYPLVTIVWAEICLAKARDCCENSKWVALSKVGNADAIYGLVLTTCRVYSHYRLRVFLVRPVEVVPDIWDRRKYFAECPLHTWARHQRCRGELRQRA